MNQMSVNKHTFFTSAFKIQLFFEILSFYVLCIDFPYRSPLQQLQYILSYSDFSFSKGACQIVESNTLIGYARPEFLSCISNNTRQAMCV